MAEECVSTGLEGVGNCRTTGLTRKHQRKLAQQAEEVEEDSHRKSCRDCEESFEKLLWHGDRQLPLKAAKQHRNL